MKGVLWICCRTYRKWCHKYSEGVSGFGTPLSGVPRIGSTSQAKGSPIHPGMFTVFLSTGTLKLGTGVGYKDL